MLEEAHEVVEAIDDKPEKLAEELGDVLLQIALHCQIASETGRFDFETVVDLIAQKMIRRHPHVFSNTIAETAGEVVNNWEKIKQDEGSSGTTPESIVDSIPKTLPALQRAQKIGEKVSRVGFDWATTCDVKAKVREELEEFLASASAADLEEEFGDVLFTVVQLARFLKIDSEQALLAACRKFDSRFRAVEAKLGGALEGLSLSQLQGVWEQVKKEQE